MSTPPQDFPRLELHSVELRTARWEELLAWYRDTLRLPVLIRIAEDGYALLGMGSVQLALLRRTEIFPAPAPRMNLVLETPDLAAIAAGLQGRCVIECGVRSHPEGYQEMVVLDPDGNRVRLLQFPCFRGG